MHAVNQLHTHTVFTGNIPSFVNTRSTNGNRIRKRKEGKYNKSLYSSAVSQNSVFYVLSMRLASVLCSEGKETSLRNSTPAEIGSKISQLLQISSAQCKQKASLYFSGTRLWQVPHTDQTFLNKSEEPSHGVYIQIKITFHCVEKKNNQYVYQSPMLRWALLKQFFLGKTAWRQPEPTTPTAEAPGWCSSTAITATASIVKGYVK